jgi:SAM-dependent methyltransferase
VGVAAAFTRRVGLDSLVQHRVVAVDALGLEDGSFNRAMMVHVGMNIPDKGAVFAEVRRALRPGGLFGLFEQMRTGEGALPYPLPWAEDESSSVLVEPSTYVQLLEPAGFVVEETADRTPSLARAGPAAAGLLGPAAVSGPGFAERMSNNVAATRAGLLAPVLVLARAR